jgi:aryl-alcohol dehydrogenase-like predicted oxidoreductase
MTIPPRHYGATDVVVSALGLGAMPLGNPGLGESAVVALLDLAEAAGITLLDTAPSYGVSEERLGRWLRQRRDMFAISTKLGYGVPGIEEWTGPCIAAGVDLALRQLQTDRLDIAHLHSCPLGILQRDDVIRAMEDAKRAGKVLAIAYSGEGDALRYAVQTGRFDGFMASLNLFDQRVIDELLPRLGGKGFIAKRPLANAPWRFSERPRGDYSESYWLRWRKMHLPDPGMPWGEMAIRFAVWHQGVASAIVGTANVDHLRENLMWAARGPLPNTTVAQIRDAFRRHDEDWTGQV